MSGANSELLQRRAQAIPNGVSSAFPIFIERASGAEIWDLEGKRYLDFVGGIAVLNVGHCHPRVTAAIREQSERFLHPAFQVQPYAPYIEVCEKVNSLYPGSEATKCALFSTGAEAVENAVKIARAHTRRRGVITFTGGFHGRTLLTLAMTGKVTPYKAGFGPFPAEVYHAPYPMEYRGIRGEDSLRAIDQLFHADIRPEDVAAIVIEPVCGEGGYYPAPAPFLRALRELCDKHGIVFVSDEIQAGFARTGRWFGIEHADVVPDVMTVAKSLAGGMPLSGVVGKASIMDAPAPGGLGGTYGGNPVACAAALATLEVIEDEQLCDRATRIGARVHEWGTALKSAVPQVGDVRGPGAMIGIELVHDAQKRTPAPDLVVRAKSIAQERGLLVLGCGYHGNVLRLMMPLTISDDQLDEGLEILAGAIRTAKEPA
ncbi:MAG: 4-aminobutyrate--2-oxoglutarate transaminase [Planctomycetes bacterium]|nr:4-aminobutyrate--2-oxoglutarate transaminase [Planctomycetota bacterium]